MTRTREQIRLTVVDMAMPCTLDHYSDHNSIDNAKRALLSILEHTTARAVIVTMAPIRYGEAYYERLRWMSVLLSTLILDAGTPTKGWVFEP